MKKIFLLVLSLSAGATFAQNGFFVQPEAGAGISNTVVKYPYDYTRYPWGVTWNTPAKNVSTFDVQILAGYKFGHWTLTTGITFLKTGFRVDTVEAGIGGFAAIWYRQDQYAYHLSVPLKIAYQCNIGSHFFIAPGIGAGVSYNYSIEIKKTALSSAFENSSGTHTLTRTEFSNNDKRTSLWGTAQVQLGYKLNKRLNVIAGPEAQYMLTSILKDKNNNQKNHAYTFNAGVTWHLKKKSNTETKSNNPVN
jgi:Outer membrane protein beta-barrel domain